MDSSLRSTFSTPSEFKLSNVAAGPNAQNCASQLDFVHPLKQSEAQHQANADAIDMRMLRSREGIHAPLKLAMERQAARKVGRLPFLTSSNAMENALTGRDQFMEFGDFLGTEEFSEVIRQPHAVVEKSLGIL